MTQQRRSNSPDSPKPRRGSFLADGSWSRSLDHVTAVENYVQSLVRARRASRLSPAQLAIQIAASGHRDAFLSVLAGGWDRFPRWIDWPLVPTRTSAEEAVKRCGAGSESHWSGGVIAGVGVTP
jgi:hypothetical protein